MANVFRLTGNLDSALTYGRLVLDDSLSKTYPAGRLKALNVVASIFETGHTPDSALKYMRLAMTVKDSLFNRDKVVAIQALTNEEQEREKQADADSLRVNNRYWLLILVGVFIAFSLVALVVLRWQRLHQLRKMRNSIADDLHDDIGSTLSSISIMSELAKVKSPEALLLLTSIEESAISLQENMSDIVWAVNPKNDRFGNLLQRMNAFASDILEARHIGLDFSSDPALDTARLSMSQRKNLYLFFKEAINNAAKYSEASRVSVSIGRRENRVFMYIRDNGRGFDTASMVNGHGMLTLKKRREELGGELSIDSWPGAGTEVNLKFKIT
jgi:signal transduction histidine kinase